MKPSLLVKTVGFLPGAGAGEGVTCYHASSATRGHPCLCVDTSTGGKVGEGAETGSIGMEKLHRGVVRVTTRYQDN